MTSSTAAWYFDRAPSLEDDRMMDVAAHSVVRRASSRPSNGLVFSGEHRPERSEEDDGPLRHHVGRVSHGSARNRSATVRYGSSRPVTSLPVPVAQVDESTPPASARLENESRFPLHIDRSGPLFCGKAPNACRRASTLSAAPNPRDESSARPFSQPPSSAQSRPSPSSANPLPQRPRSLSQISVGIFRSSRYVGDEQPASTRPRSTGRIRHSTRIVRPSNDTGVQRRTREGTQRPCVRSSATHC